MEMRNMKTPTKTLTPELLHKMDAWWRAANYLSVGQIYLHENPLLRRPLKLAHIKPRLLGPWGTTSTPFDMVVRNDLARFHLVADVMDRVPQLGPKAAYAQQAIRDKLIEHKEYIAEHGEDLSEIRDWKWNAKAPKSGTAG
jgi:phosphoketolase